MRHVILFLVHKPREFHPGSPRGDWILEDDSQSLRMVPSQRDVMNEDPPTLLSSGATESQTFICTSQFGSWGSSNKGVQTR